MKETARLLLFAGKWCIMSEIHFQKFKMEQVLQIRKITSADYLIDTANYETPPHQHDAWEFVLCLEGSVLTIQGDVLNTLHDNSFILHPPRRPHCLRIGPEGASLFVLSFVCSSDYLKLLQNRVIHISKNQRSQAMIIVHELRSAFDLQDGQLLLANFHRSSNAPLGCEQLITGCTEGLLISLLRTVTGETQKEWDAAALNRAMESRITQDVCRYIGDHLGDKLSLDSIAGELHYSRSYITEEFKAGMGVSINRYIADRRIAESKKMLEAGIPVLQISESLGYSSVQYFSKCFKDSVGVPPARFSREAAGAPH